ncbi:MAG: choice-of-anchor D domain-containing protein [Terriglobales bacterium]
MPLPQMVYRSVFFQALIVITLVGVSLPGAYASRSQLVCNPRSLWFGKVVTGQSQTQPVTLTNSGSTSVTVSGVNVSNTAFTVNNLTLPQTLVAGQSVNFSVTFTPSTTGVVDGVVSFTSNAPNNPLNLDVSGKGVNDWGLQASPASLNFGNVLVGSSSMLPMTVINTGTTSETVSMGQVGGPGYSVSGVTLPLTLEAGQSFTFSVTFAPKAVGVSLGSILASSPLSPTLTIPLSGTGGAAGQLTVAPSSINFGNVNVGQGSNQIGQLTASTSSVTVSTATMSNPAFVLSGLTLPVTIAVGQSVNYTVTFTPQSSGAVSGTLSFASNAINSPTVESLAGTGNSPQYSVDLSWSPSSGVVGYNVYRSNQSAGPYSRINSGLDPNTAYTDATVAGGQTYYYATTAVNSEGQESAYSNLAEAVIP